MIRIHGRMRPRVVTLALAMLAFPAAATARDYELLTPGPTNATSTIATRLVAASPDGARVVFTTQDPLSASDADTALDVYAYEDGVVTLLTPSTSNPVTWRGASANASRVVFETAEGLGDSDGNVDVFVSDDGSVRNVSGGVETLPALYRGISADGSRVWFVTEEALADEVQVLVDQDVFEWHEGAVSLLSTGAGDEGYQDADWAGATPNGSHVYFFTTEILCPFLEAEFPFDAFLTGAALYERVGGTTDCVDHNAERTLSGGFLGVSRNGDRVVFVSGIDLDGDEVIFGDGFLYARTGGGVAALSVDLAGAPFVGTPIARHVSTDGTRVTFSIAEDGTGDGDGAVDIYQKGPDPASLLVSLGERPVESISAEFVAATPDGSHVVFQTREALLDEDLDANVDVYEWIEGELRQVSIGPLGGNGAFDAQGVAISDDGRNVVFATNETLVAGDAANGRDLFGRLEGAQTVLLTPATTQLTGSEFADLSSDGRRLILRTRNPLSPLDQDANKDDLYGAAIDELPEPSRLLLSIGALAALRGMHRHRKRRGGGEAVQGV
jgi:hypothetical protein